MELAGYKYRHVGEGGGGEEVVVVVVVEVDV